MTVMSSKQILVLIDKNNKKIRDKYFDSVIAMLSDYKTSEAMSIYLDNDLFIDDAELALGDDITSALNDEIFEKLYSIFKDVAEHEGLICDEQNY